MITCTVVGAIKDGVPGFNECVYIVEDSNGRCLYVGQTKNLRSRFQGHLTPSRTGKLAESIRNSMPDSLIWRVELWTADEFNGNLDALESLLIAARKPLLNIEQEVHASIAYDAESTTALVTTQTDIVTFADTAGRNPVIVYLSSLAESSRRPMLQSLNVIASLVSGGVIDAMALPWGQLRYEHTQAIRSKLAEVYSAATANRHLSALRGVLKDAWRLGYMSAEDYQRAIDLKPVKGERANASEKGRHVVKGEFNALLNGCLDGSTAGARNACMIIFAYTCGLRRAELAALHLADIDTDACTLIVRSGKGGKERVIPMVDSTCDVLADWLVKRGNQPGALFNRILKGDTLTSDGLTEQAIYTIFAERATAAGVKSFTPHDLRRTFAGDLLDSGADISTVAKLMGHSSVNTTARYDRRDAKAKRKAVQSLHVPYLRQYR